MNSWEEKLGIQEAGAEYLRGQILLWCCRKVLGIHRWNETGISMAVLWSEFIEQGPYHGSSDCCWPGGTLTA